MDFFARRADLLRLESAWHRSVCTTISEIGVRKRRYSIHLNELNVIIPPQSKTFHVVYKNIPAAFTIDWIDGFLLKPFASPTYHFVYGFSQLKGSSDDGKATLSLQFQEAKRPGMKHNLIKDEVTDQNQIRLAFARDIFRVRPFNVGWCFLPSKLSLSQPSVNQWGSLPVTNPVALGANSIG